MGIYENIKEVASAHGYSINRLEKELGLPRSSISKYNKNVPSMEKIQKIADFFGVTLDFLMSGNFDTKKGYYINEEAAEMAQELFENKEMRILFDAAKGATAEDLRTAADVLLALKRKEKRDGNDQT